MLVPVGNHPKSPGKSVPEYGFQGPVISGVFLHVPETGNIVLGIDEFCYHIGGNSSALKNEFLVIKPMLQSKTVKGVIQLYNELISMSDAFPQTLKMITNAITMPISQVTCERSFSKMKLIKNYLRNSMTNERLSDLTVMAIERDFEINYESVIDKFSSNHGNCRILLL
ncbi:unnamed protein product [Rotaria socialis]|uniref:HAT C-terminal dimerisation domain-containing protein n=2 Tax=Rotaria socialis TaxID=392032 RepID=A0A818ARW5_9BILA|nr:unnamed protein product [Rotaria socialis]